jgi:predicted  nucleic acid-binding Zn-ribbon protein
LHPDLALIIDLWEVDHATDQAHVRARELKTGVDQALKLIGDIAEAQEALKIERSALKTKEAGFQRELDRYVIRRDRSKELLKGGSALDFVSVSKQLQQCADKVDELELEVLDCMETSEQQSQRATGLDADAVAAEAAHTGARARWFEEGGLLRVELEELAASRVLKWASLPKDLHSHYSDLRRRKKDVVVPIAGGNCSACLITVNAQVSVDLHGGRRLHTCRGCHRYLTLPVDEEEAEA